jgi:soluble lytic murein transglycosylase-like protein
LLCLIWKESGFDPNDKNSKSSATGLMQMTKPAVKQVNDSTPKGIHFDHSEMTDPAKNIDCGTRYLKIRIDWAKGDVTKGLEGFGTGAGYAANILECETCSKNTANNTDDCLKAIHP